MRKRQPWEDLEEEHSRQRAKQVKGAWLRKELGMSYGRRLSIVSSALSCASLKHLIEVSGVHDRQNNE